jgi:hypothetical protein
MHETAGIAGVELGGVSLRGHRQDCRFTSFRAGSVLLKAPGRDSLFPVGPRHAVPGDCAWRSGTVGRGAIRRGAEMRANRGAIKMRVAMDGAGLLVACAGTAPSRSGSSTCRAPTAGKSDGKKLRPYVRCVGVFPPRALLLRVHRAGNATERHYNVRSDSAQIESHNSPRRIDGNSSWLPRDGVCGQGAIVVRAARARPRAARDLRHAVPLLSADSIRAAGAQRGQREAWLKTGNNSRVCGC